MLKYCKACWSLRANVDACIPLYTFLAKFKCMAVHQICHNAATTVIFKSALQQSSKDIWSNA